jgi:hypothetical protein
MSPSPLPAASCARVDAEADDMLMDQKYDAPRRAPPRSLTKFAERPPLCPRSSMTLSRYTPWRAFFPRTSRSAIARDARKERGGGDLSLKKLEGLQASLRKSQAPGTAEDQPCKPFPAMFPLLPTKVQLGSLSFASRIGKIWLPRSPYRAIKPVTSNLSRLRIVLRSN